MTWLAENWDSVLAIVAGVHMAASAIVALTPTPKDDKILADLHKLVKLIGLNVGKATPKE